MNDELLIMFIEEAEELVGQLEQSLLAMETNPSDQESLHNAFRCFHTIKGGAGMCHGAEDVADYTHHVENIMYYFEVHDNQTSLVSK